MEDLKFYKIKNSIGTGQIQNAGIGKQMLTIKKLKGCCGLYLAIEQRERDTFVDKSMKTKLHLCIKYWCCVSPHKMKKQIREKMGGDPLWQQLHTLKITVIN